MKYKVLIKEYKDSDKAEVVNLLKLNTPSYFSTEEEKDLIYYLDNEIEKYYVIEIDNQIVGSGGINFENDKTTGIISWDILHPKFQKKKIGTLLLKYRIGVLSSIESIKTITVRTTQLTYEFYQKNGFELKEVEKDYWAEGFDLYKMEYKK
ncbi:GNAT family N-acetyltransferase [Albibacterium bauzanense]|uniref:Acetyltransferase (GNAT) family protein n=1 Tax=Albibacterium bauzanense TaxID=653929 RepID=A0A4R1LP35_9SPHI|nr:GNAT family N-acetyltransferase [Albibacterium bauzanense]TCK80826.1 acetyltransferase (GNAT) family protein [Albibacterium bauzanense]